MSGFVQGTLSAKAQERAERDADAAFVPGNQAKRAAIASMVAAPVVRKRVNAPATEAQIAQAVARAPERKQASKPERAPADPYVWATVTTATGVYSAEVRASTADALRASGASVTTHDERPRSQGIPAYVPPPAATRSQNYNRATIWQKASNSKAYFSAG